MSVGLIVFIPHCQHVDGLNEEITKDFTILMKDILFLL